MGKNISAILTFKCADLSVNDKKFGLVGGMEVYVVCDGLVEALLYGTLLTNNVLQLSIQALHMGVHDLYQQRLLASIMVVDARSLNSRHACNITHGGGVIAIFCKQVYRGGQNFLSHRAIIRLHLLFLFSLQIVLWSVF